MPWAGPPPVLDRPVLGTTAVGRRAPSRGTISLSGRETAVTARRCRRKGTIIKRELQGASDKAQEVTNSRPRVDGQGRVCRERAASRPGRDRRHPGWRLAASGRADVSGAVAELASQPAGPLLLWARFAACIALALWQASDAIFDFEQLPSKEKAGRKFQAGAQAVVYAGLALTFASFARGTGKDNRESTSDMTVTLMKAPGGVLLLLLIGAAVAITGIVYAIRGFRKSFEKCIRMPSSPSARKAVTGLGMAGYAAKGVALFADGSPGGRCHGHGPPPGINRARRRRSRACASSRSACICWQPWALGLICYGVYMVVRAKLARCRDPHQELQATGLTHGRRSYPRHGDDGHGLLLPVPHLHAADAGELQRGGTGDPDPAARASPSRRRRGLRRRHGPSPTARTSPPRAGSGRRPPVRCPRSS